MHNNKSTKKSVYTPRTQLQMYLAAVKVSRRFVRKTFCHGRLRHFVRTVLCDIFFRRTEQRRAKMSKEEQKGKQGAKRDKKEQKGAKRSKKVQSGARMERDYQAVLT